MINASLLNTAFRPLMATVLALALSGCSVSLFPSKQPQRQFTLPYHFEADNGGANLSDSVPVLKVNRPQASGVISGKRVVIETRPDELAAYQSVRWVTDAPELLRDHLVTALRQDPRMGTVVSDISGAGSEVTLTSSLQDFQEDRTGERTTVRLYLTAQLVENGSRRILATRNFEISVPVRESELESTIRAFGRASDRLSAEMADWLATSLADH